MLSKTEAERKILVLLERVGLSPGRDYIHSYPHDLSEEQRQRLCMALALALRPELVIADEPTAGLDVVAQARILMTLKNIILRDKASLLLLSHNLNVIASVADSVALMYNGRIIEHKETKVFFASPEHRFTKALIREHLPLNHQHTITLKRSNAIRKSQFLLEGHNLSWFKYVRSRLFWRRRQKITVIDNVSINMEPGKSVGLVGETRAGKSALVRILLGIQHPSSGEVVFNGTNLAQLSRTERKKFHQQVQVIFQDSHTSFNPRLKCGYSIAEPLRLLKGTISEADRNARILQGIIEVGLHAEDAEKYPHELSSEQRQRLALARALIVHPALIILDDPVSVLDSVAQSRFLELLIRVKERYQLSYLIASDNLSKVGLIAEQIMVIRKGMIVETGESDEILRSPQMSYTRELVRASPDLKTILTDRFPSEDWLKILR